MSKTASIAIVFTTVKAMQAEGERIGNTLKTTQNDMHALHLSIIAHLSKHKQIGVLNHYWGQIKDAHGIRRSAVIQWFDAFGTCTFNETTQQFMYDKDKTVKLADGDAKPFWKFKGMESADDKVEVLDAAGEIAKVYKRLKAKHDAEVKAGTKSEHFDRNAQLLSALAMMGSGIVPGATAH